MKQKGIISLLIALLSFPIVAFGQSSNGAIDRIKEIGMNESKVSDTIRYLTDNIGGRLTNSPSQRRANLWTKEQFDRWGLKNSKIQSWGKFGRSWEIKRFSINVVAPEYIALRAYPKAWSPATNGIVSGKLVYIQANELADLQKYKGKLKGAIILLDNGMDVTPGFEPTAVRRTDEGLKELLDAPAPVNSNTPREITYEQRKRAILKLAIDKMLYEEGVAAMLDSNWGVDSGTIRVMHANVSPGDDDQPMRRRRSRPYLKDTPATIPQFVVEVEQYNRILRRIKSGEEFQIEVNLEVNWDDSDEDGYNTIAEIPGTDLKDEIVMIGAHLDSWHSGTGATDNGAGSAVVMEAMRILAKSGLKPRRTIRVALWTGEEQGLLGSRAYVRKEFGYLRADGSINKTKNYDKFAAYFNLDNGTGQIRGIFSQGNSAARNIFQGWLEPFSEFGAVTTTLANTGGTDHLAFDAIGLPGFQFIQDPIEYRPRTWHTTQDVFDRTLEEDLKISSVIMAAFAYNAAMTDQKLPRKTLNASANLRIPTIKEILDDAHYAHSNFAICGHEISYDEIPAGFPAQYAIRNAKPEDLASE